MASPLVSVITPAYNCAEFLAETVDSVLSQDYPDIEYRVLNDGSTDKTLWVLDKYETRYSEKLTVYNHPNMGEQNTVNRGMSLAKGRYFMVVNADDPLLPSAVSTLVDFMECHPNIAVAYPCWMSIKQDGTPYHYQTVEEYDFINMVRYHKCMPSVGAIVRREVIDAGIKRDPQYRYVGDFDYWLRVGLHFQMARVPETLACWRHSNHQLTEDNSRAIAKEHVTLMRNFFSMADLSPEVKVYEKEALFWAYMSAAYLSEYIGLGYVKEAFCQYPESLIKMNTYRRLCNHAKYILKR